MRSEVIGKIFCLSIIATFLPWLYISRCFAYDVTSAVQYGNKWWGDDSVSNEQKNLIYNTWGNEDTDGSGPDIGHDPIYYNDYTLNSLGGVDGDCANFVSQCLRAGGLGQEIENYLVTWSTSDLVNYAGKKFDSGHPHGSQLYYGVASGGVFGTFVHPPKLRDFLIDYYHALYIKGKAPTVPENSFSLDAGDVYLIIGGATRHSTFIISGTGISSIYACHTYDKNDGNVPDTYDDSRHFFHMVRAVPNVEHVEVKQGTEIIYDGLWSGSATPRSLNISQQPADTSDDLIITIDFNESVQNISVKAKDNSNTVSVSGALNPVLSTQWIGTLSKSQFSSGQLTGEVTLVIEARNYASSSNLLDADPKTVPLWRDVTRDFTDYENASKNATNITTGGVDTLHLWEFRFC